MIHRHIIVTGRVQNVFFRDWTVETARALGIDGWVRNRADGSVEIRAAGAAESITTFIARCHEGPPAARVEHVEVAETPAERLDGFEKRATV